MPRPPQLSPEILATFVTIVETGGDASEACRIMDINQPSMSKRLAFLQHAGKLLKSPWLDKHGKTWLPTETGQKILPSVKALLNTYQAILDEAVDIAVPVESIAIGSEHLPLVKGHIPSEARVVVCDDYDRVDMLANGAVSVILTSFTKEEAKTLSNRDFNVRKVKAGVLATLNRCQTDYVAQKFGFLREKSRNFLESKNVVVEIGSLCELAAFSNKLGVILPSWYCSGLEKISPEIPFDVSIMTRKTDCHRDGTDKLVEILSKI